MSDPATRLVNGVFQGGGAKVIACAGALRAVEGRGLWFGSVAGSSGGAIVASLIAAGMSTDDMESKVSELLAAAHSPTAARLAKLVVGHAHSRFEGHRLRASLDTTYRTSIGATSDAPVTFADLFESTGIELYVLAVDLSNGLPVVFCRRTTPRAEVAGAVAASSAIPAAFPAGRAVFDSVESGAVVHQLIDGGAWANYPSFVFDDRSFRCWLRDETNHLHSWNGDADDTAWDAEEARPIVGFVLSDPEPLANRNPAGFVPLEGPDINRRFDRGPTYTSGKTGTYLVGAVLSSDWARAIIALATLVWVGTSVSTVPIGFRRYSTWLAGWIPDWLFPLALVGTMALVALAAIASIVLIAGLILVSRMLADTVLPSAKAVLGVPMEVPPWLGNGDDSVLVRVPHGELSTTDFDVDEATRARAVELAETSVAEQLADPNISGCLEALFGGPPFERPEVTRGKRTLDPTTTDDRMSVLSVVSLVVATSLIGVLAWWATNTAGADSIGWILFAVAVAVAVGVAALVSVGGAAGDRAATRAGLGVTTTSRRSTPVAAGWMIAGVALIVAGAVVSAWTMDDRSDATTEAEVTAAETSAIDEDVNLYDLRIDGTDQTISVESERHLRLGERAFVEIDEASGRASLVGALDDVRFAAAIVLCLLGLFVLTAGARTYRYATRCRRLDTIVTAWRDQ